MILILASLMIEIKGIGAIIGIAAIMLYGIHKLVNYLLKEEKKKRWFEE